MRPIAFSTCWNSSRHTDGETMLREIKEELGFSTIELGHGTRISLMPGIQKMREKGEVVFTSLHNFCPLPVEVTHAAPDIYQFSSGRTAERERAVKQTQQTIDFAQRLGAPFVVMHCGSVPMNPITDELIAMIKRGEHLSREYVRKKIDAVKKRESAAAVHIERVLDCLKRVVDYAATKGVRLGIEGRRGYEEMPSERELPMFLDELRSPFAGYWHDMGHIQIKENLGFLNHEEWLRTIGPRTFGCHLQDVIWPGQDHQPPFAGHCDLLKLVPLLPDDCLFVWELSPRKKVEEIVRSVETWRQHFGR
jgi:sugar phosphate isomerase/epimerase